MHAPAHQFDVRASARYQRRLSFHGRPVEINCDVDEMHACLDRVLGGFSVERVLLGSVTRGSIRPYVEDEVLPTLSDSATRVMQYAPWLELYQDGQRFWLVDETWGMLEIDYARNCWRSWVLGGNAEEPMPLMEKAVLWPMAQLLRNQGLHLVPAPSVARDGWAALLLTSYCVESELRCLAAAGYRIIGQRWTALSQDQGRVRLMHMPGMVQRALQPRRYTAPGSNTNPTQWVDLTAEFPAAVQHEAACQAVLIVEAAHRAVVSAADLSPTLALGRLRRIWPVIDLGPRRRKEHPAAWLAGCCPTAQIQISRRPSDLILLLDSLRREWMRRRKTPQSLAASAALLFPLPAA